MPPTARPAAGSTVSGVPVATLRPPLSIADAVLTLAPLRRGPGDPAWRHDGERLWLAARTPEGPAALELASVATGLRACGHGPGGPWLVARVAALLGVGVGAGPGWDDLELTGWPRLAEVRRRHPGLRLPATGIVLDSLLAAVLEQRVTGLEAHRAWRRLLLDYGTALPAPVPTWLRVPPTADIVLAVPTWAWHRYAVDHRRQAALRAVATVAERLQALAAAGPDRLGAALRSIPGVGAWTVAETTLRVCADPDAVSVGDYHLAHTVVHAFTGRPRGTDAEMLELLAPFAGRRAMVIRLIELAGVGAPRFGPRLTVHPHA